MTILEIRINFCAIPSYKCYLVYLNNYRWIWNKCSSSRSIKKRNRETEASVSSTKSQEHGQCSRPHCSYWERTATSPSLILFIFQWVFQAWHKLTDKISLSRKNIIILGENIEHLNIFSWNNYYKAINSPMFSLDHAWKTKNTGKQSHSCRRKGGGCYWCSLLLSCAFTWCVHITLGTTKPYIHDWLQGKSCASVIENWGKKEDCFFF